MNRMTENGRKQLEALVHEVMKDGQARGIAVGIVDSDGKIQYEQYFGYRDEEKKLPIEFIGPVPRTQLFEQYASSVLVFPSYIETIGLPLLEARSVGAPILAADCLYARDGVGGYEKAEFFETFDSEALSRLMKQKIVEK